MKILLHIKVALTIIAVSVLLTCCDDKKSDPTLEISLEPKEVSASADTADLTIRTNTVWIAYVSAYSEDAAEEWITFSERSGRGNDVTEVRVGKNNGGLRTADITVTAGDIERTVRITQRGRGLAEWTELPAIETDDNRVFYTHYAEMNGEQVRNYSLLYDKSYRTAMWVAYPLCSSHMGTVQYSSWNQDPEIELEHQVIVTRGYGVSYPEGTNNLYGRGHQIPDADRDGIRALLRQTYYFTNATPQIQNGFNGGIWSSIEGRVRANVGTLPTDTVWVATGAVFRTVGGVEAITQIENEGNDGSIVDVPNYYYKVALKKKADNSYTSIAFWIEHAYYTGAGVTPANFVTTVRDVEQKTGFDFFANLPKSVQDQIETQTNRSDWGL